MTFATRFLHRCRGWKQGLEYALFIARDSRVRLALVLEVACDDEDEADLRAAFPGWTIQWVEGEWRRLVPPGYLVPSRASKREAV